MIFDCPYLYLASTPCPMLTLNYKCSVNMFFFSFSLSPNKNKYKRAITIITILCFKENADTKEQSEIGRQI